MVNLAAGGDLYDAVLKKHEGYAGDEVPLNHRVAVASALAEEVESGFGGAGHENF
ncbi:MAG: hypothetical protein LBT74_08275 [Acidobacteriota bacterium]|nr:hypothetical protein [Acidobacteriota bacterium]